MKKSDTPGGRFYEIGGVSYPSVTSILGVIGKPALVAWSAKVEREMVTVEAAKLQETLSPCSTLKFSTELQKALGKEKAHKKELAKAGEIGTQAHSLIEWTLRTQLCEKVGASPEIGSQAQWAYASWQRWAQGVKLKPIWVERSVYSAKWGYAGTADLLAEIDGIETLLDWKTGKRIYPESFLQNVAYRECVKELGYGDPKRGMIVRLPKIKGEPDFEVQEVPVNYDQQLETFLHAFELWKWQNAPIESGAPGPPKAQIPSEI